MVSVPVVVAPVVAWEWQTDASDADCIWLARRGIRIGGVRLSSQRFYRCIGDEFVYTPDFPVGAPLPPGWNSKSSEVAKPVAKEPVKEPVKEQSVSTLDSVVDRYIKAQKEATAAKAAIGAQIAQDEAKIVEEAKRSMERYRKLQELKKVIDQPEGK